MISTWIENTDREHGGGRRWGGGVLLLLVSSVFISVLIWITPARLWGWRAAACTIYRIELPRSLCCWIAVSKIISICFVLCCEEREIILIYLVTAWQWGNKQSSSYYIIWLWSRSQLLALPVTSSFLPREGGGKLYKNLSLNTTRSCWLDIFMKSWCICWTRVPYMAKSS